MMGTAARRPGGHARGKRNFQYVNRIPRNERGLSTASLNVEVVVNGVPCQLLLQAPGGGTLRAAGADTGWPSVNVSVLHLDEATCQPA